MSFHLPLLSGWGTTRPLQRTVNQQPAHLVALFVLNMRTCVWSEGEREGVRCRCRQHCTTEVRATSTNSLFFTGTLLAKSSLSLSPPSLLLPPTNSFLCHPVHPSVCSATVAELWRELAVVNGSSPVLRRRGFDVTGPSYSGTGNRISRSAPPEPHSTKWAFTSPRNHSARHSERGESFENTY